MAQKPLVFVCDDDQGIVDFTKIVLEEKGCEVMICLNSDAVLKGIKEHTPQLILLDLWMPSIGGAETIKKIRHHFGNHPIPIIIFSASKETEQVALSLKVSDFLTKPFDIEELEKIVERHLPGNWKLSE